MTSGATLVWFRNDLRLADNPALSDAVSHGGPVVPVYLWCPEQEGDWPAGGASRCWLHRSLESLDRCLRKAGSRLVIRQAPALEGLIALARECGATRVVWNRRYEPQVVERDRKVKEGLRNAGLEAGSWNALLLAEPWTIRNKAGGPFQVFSPYWRHCLQSLDPAAPLPAPDGVASPRRWPAGEALDALDLLPRIPWDAGIRRDWCPGEASAVRRLEAFVQQGLAGYGTERDRPGHPGTSRLSPHLHFGEISPRQVWHSIATAAARRGIPPETWKSWQFLAEVGWREFAHHLLFHFPHTPRLPLRHEFGGFPWRVDPAALRLWQRGLTGYPLVDAGMRELWETGWMHNRVRMVTASFLVKHLLLSWEEGARWFWDTLVDADLASNTLGWQWTAGCGADAAPYFRVFNPVSQGERYDPAGEYVRRWVPELRALPNDWIHQPWAAPRDVLQAAGVRLGGSYPRPIVDHAEARTRALAAYAASRGR